MKVINLIAGPGVGKSVMASDLFSVLKKAGIEVEMASEYAKDMVYEKRTNILKDQIYVLAKQNRRLSRLQGAVDWAISDSPLLLCPIYAGSDYYPNFKALALDVWNQYDNITLFLRRNEDRAYQPIGRTQDEAGAKEMDQKIYDFLVDNQIPFISVDGREKVDFDFVRRYILDEAFKEAFQKVPRSLAVEAGQNWLPANWP